MELDRQVLILKNIIRQYEDTYEGACMELRISVKVKDEKGIDAIKKTALELEGKVEAAKAMLAEMMAKQPEPGEK